MFQYRIGNRSDGTSIANVGFLNGVTRMDDHITLTVIDGAGNTGGTSHRNDSDVECNDRPIRGIVDQWQRSIHKTAFHRNTIRNGRCIVRVAINIQ